MRSDGVGSTSTNTRRRVRRCARLPRRWTCRGDAAQLDNSSQAGRMQRTGLTTMDRARLKELERENRFLLTANEILRKTSAYLVQAELVRRPKSLSRFIDDHRAPYGVESICRSPRQHTIGTHLSVTTRSNGQQCGDSCCVKVARCTVERLMQATGQSGCAARQHEPVKRI